ncbi:phosphate acyltransferase PlsX [Bilophila wadsworthia]|uniref:phosphate acyltransferase PlsX n=1 Tax=Bilophila wadsworthia TaxID=35833 RepID=UPI0024332B49|nr:phosphate acyltransferase PlsX [Bilophila wadsworthia]
MAVQQNKKSHSKKGMRRSHDRVATPTVVYCTCEPPRFPTLPAPAAAPTAVVRSSSRRPPMSSNKTVIAVDAMGGDLGPSVVVPGAIEAARQTGAKILLVGNEATLDGELNRLSPSGVDLEIVHAPEVAGMDEKPSDILRRKKNASIQVACRLVRDGAAQGVVSAGHSGASVACGMFIMGRIPGVERPALASLLPTEKEPVVLLDVGATVDCKPYNIFQFGLMGDAFARDILNKESPRVGLLSIGEEEGKGNSQVKEAYELFKMAQNLNFSGNIEGRDLFTGEMDVAVCDGFVGNVALKLSEGLGLSLSRVLKRELLNSGFLPTLGSLLAKSAFRRFAKVVDYAEYGGAPLLGLQNISIVCHGRSNAKAICNATRMATLFVEKETNKRLMETICANEELTRFGRSC